MSTSEKCRKCSGELQSERFKTGECDPMTCTVVFPQPHVTYGLRDDLLMTISLQPPQSQYVITATGRTRDILKLLNETEWRAYRMEVDVDEFMKRFHSSDTTVRDEK